jgi:non-specific serine/threonine protein kinase
LTLKEKIKSRLPEIDAAVKIITQVAEGLGEAHAKGIIHRDIKPANIMLTEKGMVKIMDFGIAKWGGGADLTKTFALVGTVPYMSPEQVKGEKVDYRTDIWSLGAMFYEMLTGSRPFKKDQEHALVYEIIHREPEIVSSIRKDIPKHIEQVILKALEKDPEKRYQSVEKMKQDLKVSSPLTLPKTECSIVVLPFEDMSPNKDNEYFSDGLTDEIITDLSQIHSLCVISRNSAMALKGTKKNTKTIGRELNVQNVLEGSVRKAGNNLRITAQLIDARTDVHLWAKKYTGTLDDVFDIQEKVSRSIVEALKLKLSPDENQRISERLIDNIPAFELYLKAYAEIFKFSEEAINKAIGYLQNALNIIGDNALLHSGIAFAYFNLVNIGVKHEEYILKAEEHVKKALSMDAEFPKAHVVMAWIHAGSDPSKSAFHAKKALAISPDDSIALGVLAIDYMAMGKIEAAEYVCGRLMKIDPLDFPPNYAKGALDFYRGQYNKSLRAWKKLYEMYPDSAYSRWSYALILTYNNQFDEAFSIIDQSAKKEPGSVLTKLGLILKYGLQGEKDEAFQEMTPEFQKTCRRDYSYAHHLAGIFASLDEKQEALNWLESAINCGLINYPLLNEQDPLLENIRNEPRFKNLMESVKHEWENFEV